MHHFLLIRRLTTLLLLLVFATAAHAAAPPTAIRVVVDDNYPPYIFRDANGRVQGILKDLWDLWQQRTGVAVELKATDWGKAQEIMLAGEADVIDTMFETAKRRRSYDFSRPYATIEAAIFFHRSIGGITDADSLQGFTVGVKEGDACIEFLSARDIEDFKRYASYEALVKAAARQEIRVLCIDLPPADYFFNREGLADAFRHSKPLYTGEFHWAVAKGRTDLKHLIEDGFARITPEERMEIENRWLGTRLAAGMWPRLARYGAFALIAAALLVGVLIGWNRALRRRVAARTTELTTALASLRESEGRFRTLFEQANDAILIMHGATVLDCNRRTETLHGIPRDQIIGNTPASASPALQPDGRPSEQVMREMVARAEAGQPVVFEWRNLRPDGSPLDVEVSLSRIDFGGESRLQAIVRDITERKLAQAEIQRLAYFDPLTQLPNRRMLLERLRHALAACNRRHAVGAVLFIDLDNFKTLNDTRGHDVGDSLLKEVGQRLRGGVRAEDFIARLGGDEFVVLLDDLHGSPHEAATQAEAVAHKLLDAVGQPYLLDTFEYHTTTSIGLCLFSGTREESVEEILKRADAAMYRAKTAGRNTLSFFDPAMQVSLETRAAMEAELRRALPQQQLRLHFQPQVDNDHHVVGAEALLRWEHPERGLISPAQFIPLAEETGLIVPIGQWVLESACAQLRSWNAMPDMADFRIAVNVSARQFRHADFVVTVRNIVGGSGIDPRNLTLELTESLVLDNVADSIEKMHALKRLGVGFSIDDFGTGYSSLSYLKRLPLDELKIDQSFVRDVATDPGDAVIVRTIIAMARNFGLTVVAEGVETHHQRDFLLQQDCRLFQGYLFARPLPGNEFYRRFCAEPRGRRAEPGK